MNALAYQAQDGDQTLATAGDYSAVLRRVDESAIVMVVKKVPGKESEVLDGDEDLYALLERTVPAKEAGVLATALTKREIEQLGGVEKARENVKANIGKFGHHYYDRVSLLYVAGYKANGIELPTRRKAEVVK